MLDTQTKRRIDSARDILVGKVPDPKSQVEMITMAMIYKFMDDMDNQAVEYGGNRSFFTGDYEKFAWTKLFDLKLSGQETLNLYADAISSFAFNPNLPQLFRDIFKNAYLPFRDPQTLKLFLKTINDFHYDHSEKLGDAFEYLLSVLGSQGDAGQFRTPRHIIDFMVEILDPKKGDTIADPACGTAGFLISSYKHILKQNTKNSLGDLLTPDERTKLMTQFTGYDISPDMVRLSLVNMYLHGFPNPNIQEYDTLTSEEKWDEYFDIILANPPFMTPKGGIRPHNRFSVQANKAEVLFTDYIAEHINPVSGKAAIVVPNGIVATTNKAYKELRKLLVNESLLAVISLPAGVFQPYSGVKTSVLILDKRLAKKTDKILFLKINNDGFDLGAQRRPIDKNDLPKALETIQNYRDSISKGEEYIFDWENISLTEKTRILESNDISLSAERYFEKIQTLSNFEIVRIGDFVEYVRGITYTKGDESMEITENPVLRANNIDLDYTLNLSEIKYISERLGFGYMKRLCKNDIFICSSSGSKQHLGKVAFIEENTNYLFGGFMGVIRVIDSRLDAKFLFRLFKSDFYKQFLKLCSEGANINNLKVAQLMDFEIPLPPLEIQKEIVAEIEGYQKIIDGAKQVVENYKPTIKINPDWEMVELGEVCDINLKASDPIRLFGNETFTYIDIESIENGTGKISFKNVIDPIEAPSRARRIIKNDDIALSTVRPNLRAFGYLENLPKNCLASTGFAILSVKQKLISKFLYFIVHQDYMVEQMVKKSGKGQYPSITASDVKELLIPLPPLEIQQQIVSQIEEEQKMVDANKKLIEIFEQKIKARIDEVWGVKK